MNEFLSIRDVSKLTGLTPQIIRRHCANGKIKAFQIVGANSKWRIETEQFSNLPTWERFQMERNERFERSAEVAKIAKKMWEEQEE